MVDATDIKPGIQVVEKQGLIVGLDRTRNINEIDDIEKNLKPEHLASKVVVAMARSVDGAARVLLGFQFIFSESAETVKEFMNPMIELLRRNRINVRHVVMDQNSGNCRWARQCASFLTRYSILFWICFVHLMKNAINVLDIDRRKSKVQLAYPIQTRKVIDNREIVITTPRSSFSWTLTLPEEIQTNCVTISIESNQDSSIRLFQVGDQGREIELGGAKIGSRLYLSDDSIVASNSTLRKAALRIYKPGGLSFKTCRLEVRPNGSRNIRLSVHADHVEEFSITQLHSLWEKGLLKGILSHASLFQRDRQSESEASSSFHPSVIKVVRENGCESLARFLENVSKTYNPLIQRRDMDQIVENMESAVKYFTDWDNWLFPWGGFAGCKRGITDETFSGLRNNLRNWKQLQQSRRGSTEQRSCSASSASTVSQGAPAGASHTPATSRTPVSNATISTLCDAQGPSAPSVSVKGTQDSGSATNAMTVQNTFRLSGHFTANGAVHSQPILQPLTPIAVPPCPWLKLASTEITLPVGSPISSTSLPSMSPSASSQSSHPGLPIPVLDHACALPMSSTGLGQSRGGVVASNAQPTTAVPASMIFDSTTACTNVVEGFFGEIRMSLPTFTAFNFCCLASRAKLSMLRHGNPKLGYVRPVSKHYYPIPDLEGSQLTAPRQRHTPDGVPPFTEEQLEKANTLARLLRIPHRTKSIRQTFHKNAYVSPADAFGSAAVQKENAEAYEIENRRPFKKRRRTT